MCPVVKKKAEKKKLPGSVVLMFFTILCIALMVFTFISGGEIPFVDSAAGYVIVPFQKGISNISSWMVSRSDARKTMLELQEEKMELEHQVDELLIENAQLMQDHYELATLRELYDLDKNYSEYEKVGARVIGANSSNWFETFIIDKGSDDGITVDMNVMAGSGLVGIVVETGNKWSRVRSIISDSSNVSASILHTQDNLIISGSLDQIQDGYLTFSRLSDPDDEVAIGDKVVTSNISDKYLPGILIGYVHSLELDANNMTKSGRITPVVDFRHMTEVLVITTVKQSVED